MIRYFIAKHSGTSTSDGLRIIKCDTRHCTPQPGWTELKNKEGETMPRILRICITDIHPEDAHYRDKRDKDNLINTEGEFRLGPTQFFSGWHAGRYLQDGHVPGATHKRVNGELKWIGYISFFGVKYEVLSEGIEEMPVKPCGEIVPVTDLSTI